MRNRSRQRVVHRGRADRFNFGHGPDEFILIAREGSAWIEAPGHSVIEMEDEELIRRVAQVHQRSCAGARIRQLGHHAGAVID